MITTISKWGLGTTAALSVFAIFGGLAFFLWASRKNNKLLGIVALLIIIAGFTSPLLFGGIVKTINENFFENYWDKDSDGVYQKIPPSIWWATDIANELKDGDIINKQTPEKNTFVAVCGTNCVLVTWGVVTPEEELSITKRLPSSALEYNLGEVVKDMILQSLGRHENDPPGIGQDQELSGITLFDVKIMK
jgi:hypothetical protein